MPDRIPVFDDWGNKVGDFIPNGGSDAIFGLLAFIMLWILGIGFYALYRLIRKGFEAVKEKDWGTAFLCLIPIWLPVISLFIVAISTMQVQAQENLSAAQTSISYTQVAAKETESQATAAARATDTYINIENQLVDNVHVSNVELLTEKQVMWKYLDYLDKETDYNRVSFIRFMIVNDSKFSVGLYMPMCGITDNYSGWWYSPMDFSMGSFMELKPSSRLNFTCWLVDTNSEQIQDPKNYCSITLAVWEWDRGYPSIHSTDISKTWNLCPLKNQ